MNFWTIALFLGLGGAAAWGSMSPQTRQKVLLSLNEWAEAAARQAQERDRQQRLALPAGTGTAALTTSGQISGRAVTPALQSLFPSLPALGSLSAPKPTMLEADARLRQVITHPSVVLILGKRGSGKSALGYRLLELFRYGAKPYVVGVPTAARKLLPDWIGIASSLEDVPPRSIALVDEAYLAYHARGSMAQQSKAMSQHLNLSRQRQQTLVFVSQEARQVDRNIASSANVVIFKDLGMLQLEFDRPELNKLSAQANAALAGVKGDKRGWAYAYAPDNDFLGLLENALPSFWKPSLSRLFAAESLPAASRLPKAMTPQEKAAKAAEMRAIGASYSQIAQGLGVTRGTVVNYLKGYPYRAR